MKYRCSTCRNVYVEKLAAEMCHAGQQPAYVYPGHENDPAPINDAMNQVRLVGNWQPFVPKDMTDAEKMKAKSFEDTVEIRPNQGMDQPHHGHKEEKE